MPLKNLPVYINSDLTTGKITKIKLSLEPNGLKFMNKEIQHIFNVKALSSIVKGETYYFNFTYQPIINTTIKGE
jgi:hypothetical protein